MPPQFKNMNDLIDYLSLLEQRVKKLETEKGEVHRSVPVQENVDENVIRRHLSRILPPTNLFNPSFLKRAFTVWGHFFVANMIIGIIFGIGYACLMMVLFGSMFGNILQNSK